MDISAVRDVLFHAFGTFCFCARPVSAVTVSVRNLASSPGSRKFIRKIPYTLVGGYTPEMQNTCMEEIGLYIKRVIWIYGELALFL